MKFFEDIDYKIIKNSMGDIYKIGDYTKFPDYLKGEFYFSEVMPRTIKTWRKHKKLNCIIGVAFGNVLIKLKSDLKTKEISNRNLCLTKSKMIKINAGTWYSFENKSNNSCLLFVILNGKHDDNELERL